MYWYSNMESSKILPCGHDGNLTKSYKNFGTYYPKILHYGQDGM